MFFFAASGHTCVDNTQMYIIIMYQLTDSDRQLHCSTDLCYCNNSYLYKDTDATQPSGLTQSLTKKKTVRYDF